MDRKGLEWMEKVLHDMRKAVVILEFDAVKDAVDVEDCLGCDSDAPNDDAADDDDGDKVVEMELFRNFANGSSSLEWELLVAAEYQNQPHELLADDTVDAHVDLAADDGDAVVEK
jgi:hypothetical protein